MRSASPDNPAAWLPPVPRTSDGRARKVGIELEFSGISFGATTRAVAAWAGVEARYDSLVQAVVDHPSLGEFEIEVDWLYLKDQAQAQQLHEGSSAWVKFLRQAARVAVPVEVVAPPVDIEQLPQLEELINSLRRAGATGTDSPIAAFGLHLNPEVPAVSAQALVPYLKAFALLQWWLVEQHQVDITRRLSPYVHPYPEAYLELVLSYGEEVDMMTLLDDYFTHNPTRNRALDLWPLFAHHAPERVETLMHEPLIKPRPTFHYRLPNCEVDRIDWGLWQEWNLWLQVERLAADVGAIGQLTHQFFHLKRPLLGVSKTTWLKTLNQWLAGNHD